MQNDELNDCPDTDVARPGHDSATPAPTDGVEEGKRRDADKADLARSEQGRVAPQEAVAKPGIAEESLEAEYQTLANGPTSVEIMHALAWQGPLPHPDDFNSYPEVVQQELLRVYISEQEKRMDRQDKILEASINLDAEQSRREDELVNAEIKQAEGAQQKTVGINTLLVISAIILALCGHEGVAIAMIGALAVVNITTLFVHLRKPSEEKLPAPPEHKKHKKSE